MYGIIVEHKLERPIIIESRPMTEDAANNKMVELSKLPYVIRVAMFRIEIVNGNETLGE